MYAPAKKVDNLIATIDLTEKQIDGTDEVCSNGKYPANLKLLTGEFDIKE
jgi:transketolase N-terminal domain/subunit